MRFLFGIIFSLLISVNSFAQTGTVTLNPFAGAIVVGASYLDNYVDKSSIIYVGGVPVSSYNGAIEVYRSINGNAGAITISVKKRYIEVSQAGVDDDEATKMEKEDGRTVTINILGLSPLEIRLTNGYAYRDYLNDFDNLYNEKEYKRLRSALTVLKDKFNNEPYVKRYVITNGESSYELAYDLRFFVPIIDALLNESSLSVSK